MGEATPPYEKKHFPEKSHFTKSKQITIIVLIKKTD